MIISYKFLQSFFKEELGKPKELIEKITLHAFEVELPLKVNGDCALEIKVLPDRGSDALSHLGIARECAAILGLKLAMPKILIKEDDSLHIGNFLEAEVRNNGCRRYMARVLTGVEIGESPDYIKERLKTCGISSINNVVDITNYVMLELGQPLHAFDYEKLSENKKIIIDKANKGEKFESLSNDEYILDTSILTIRDEKDVLAIAGIKGGTKAEVKKTTKAIVLESANFGPNLIYKTSKKIKLRTDSSLRFSHDLDPNLAELALERAAALIQELTGAKVLKGVIDVYPLKEKPKKLLLNINYLRKFLGMDVPLNDIKRILRSLEFEITKEEKDKIQVEVPSFRRDISIEENLIEEVGRIYGYDKIEPVFPVSAQKIERNDSLYWQNNFRSVLKELGFFEVYNYSFIGEKDKADFNLSKLVELENPIAIESEYLRSSLIPNLIKNLRLNLRYEKDIKIYEIGSVFKRNGSFIEKKLFSGLIFPQDYSNLKGYLEEIFNDFGIVDIEYIPNQKEDFMSKRKSAIIKINKKEVGVIGHLSRYVLNALNLDIDPVLFELDFDIIEKGAKNENEYTPVSLFPVATRDISVIVPSNTRIGDVTEVIAVSEGKLLKDIELLDVYDNYAEDLKSITFRIFLQAMDRSLGSEEINKIHEKIISNLEQNPEWEVKK
ncbi:MAG: phenylalanine--tRNA ligase subunit beta [Candidatus Pacebacteria bacterium]|nr:phenylalanine--tRNA ligase subunit beta [Candidatus Paceibacterota bacterium]